MLFLGATAQSWAAVKQIDVLLVIWCLSKYLSTQIIFAMGVLVLIGDMPRLLILSFTIGFLNSHQLLCRLYNILSLIRPNQIFEKPLIILCFITDPSKLLRIWIACMWWVLCVSILKQCFVKNLATRTCSEVQWVIILGIWVYWWLCLIIALLYACECCSNELWFHSRVTYVLLWMMAFELAGSWLQHRYPLSWL